MAHHSPQKLLLIVDGSSILHRAYHALPPFTAPDGRLVNAVYGFMAMFLKALNEVVPTHIAVTFDLPGGTFRNKLFPAYQEQREKKPNDLYAQIPIIKDLLAGLGVPVYGVSDFEADDVIGTIVDRARKPESQKARERQSGSPAPQLPSSPAHIIILTGDKDLLQLVRDGVTAILFRRGMTDTARYDVAGVIERFGFPPERLPDYKALAGDPSDNYPGVPGVGEKTATELVKEFGGIAEIMKNAKCRMQNAELRPPFTPKLAQRICDHEADAELGLKLSTIVRNVPVNFALADCERRPYDRNELVEKLRGLGFTSLLGRLPEQTAPHTINDVDNNGDISTNPLDAAAIVTNAKTLTLATVSDDAGNPIALGIANDLHGVGLPWNEAMSIYPPILSDNAIIKDVHDAKTLIHALRKSKVELNGLRYDTEILSYLLAPGSRSHDLAHTAFAELGVEIEPEARGQRPEASESDTLRASSCELQAAHSAMYVSRFIPILTKKVEDADLMRVYEEFERPLIPVLQRMEEIGIRLDTVQLAQLEKRMRHDIDVADHEITALAGEEFNIDSPLQLKRILFEKLGIAVRGIKKTAKGGGLSTAASELEKLRGAHPIIAHIFTHRELQKLLSTYVESLPVLVDSADNRLHTTYNQTVTATGRLSSSNPNLQNIPVSEPWGPEIRKAFVASEGWQLIALDYSQFELRIAATLSGDKTLLKAFQCGADIHAATGVEVFGVKSEEVTRDQRRVAKAINFGILYGMGANALAASAGISRAEAEEYIARYFQAYAGLHDWIETTKALARSRGYVETLFGRKRFLPEITSGMPQVRAAAERMAVNMPIQGTQADLLKRAMIRADEWIWTSRKPEVPMLRSGSRYKVVGTGSRKPSDRVRMVLTVHDELVFEVREDFVPEATRALKDILEGVHRISVPIIVEAKVGKNWGEMEKV